MTVSPTEVPSSGEAESASGRAGPGGGRRQGARLARVQRVEVVNSLQAIDASGVLPRWVLVTRPFHQVLELAPTAKKTGIQDVVHVVFVFAVHHYRRRRRLDLTGEEVIGGVFQQGHVEDGVELHGRWEAEAGGMRCAEAGIGDDLKGAKAAVVELAGWATGDDVPGVQPDFVTGQESGCRSYARPISARRWSCNWASMRAVLCVRWSSASLAAGGGHARIGRRTAK